MPSASKIARFALAVVVLCSLAVEPDASAQVEADLRFLDGLRQRRLFSLVEAYCRERLGDNGLTDAERAELTVELIRGYAYHAVNLPASTRSQQWQKAHEVADQFVRQYGTNARAMLVRVQQALTHLAHGELLRQELEAEAGGEGTRDLALQELRHAARQLETLDEQASRQLPRLSGRKPENDELSYDELFSLQNNVRFQLARVYRNRALCYPAGGVDRIDALTRAIEQQQALLRRLAADDPLRWDVELDRIACERGLDHIDAARQQLIAFQSEAKPGDVELRARAEHLRLELAAGRPEKALEIARLGRVANGRTFPDLDFAILETYNALANSADDKEEAAQWRDRSVAMQQLMEQLHGPYWGRRATLLVVRSAAETGDVNNLQVLITLAEEAWRKQQYNDALSAFEKAASQAERIGDAAQAFALHYKAALVQQEGKHHRQAAVSLRRLATAMKEHPSASQAHLLAVWNAAQVVRADASALPDYVELLEEHLAIWPNEVSADTARHWLARLREHQQEWDEALDIYLETSPASDLYAEAIANASRCAYRHLDQLQASSATVAATAELLAERFEALLYGEGGQLPATWNPALNSAALAGGKLRLQYAHAGPEKASRYLQAALDSSPDAESSWKSAARSLLVVALAGQQGRSADAARILEKIAGASAAELLQMAFGLSAIRDAAPEDAKGNIAALQLQSIDLLAGKTSQLDPDQQRLLEHLRAGALQAAGRRDEALVAYQRLAAAYPDSGPIQVDYGELLLSGPDKASLEAALGQWRSIGRRSKPRSDRWFLSKYNIALAQHKLSMVTEVSDAAEAANYRQRAQQMLQFLRDTPPGWKQSPLKSEFERLLQRCGTE